MAPLLPNTFSSPENYVPHDPQRRGGPYPPNFDLDQSTQKKHPETYRLPPPYPHYVCQYPPAPLAAPALRQRTAIACKFCRKRKIRCSGYNCSPNGRCQNCVRFNQQCLFHPVSSQAVFVPASVVYGSNAGALVAACPPQRFPSQGHHNPLAHYTPPGQPYEQHGLASISQGQDERVGLKRAPPDEDSHNEDSHTHQSPHSNVKPYFSIYDSHADSGRSYSYPGPSHPTTSSHTIPTMSHPSHLPPTYANDNQAQQYSNSPPAGPHSTYNFHFPHIGPVRDDDKTPLPGHPHSTRSSITGQTGMSLQDLLHKTP